ncbi:MAG: hypothetical protein H6595_13230 [Flavobacteriales bacterium]|nr:hypothetical protein [Flavobacteriales bacterium]MCB9168428.1 hypothetical protein [Flavobacteriales bacterium]
MNPILRNILAVVAAFVLGGAMNMGLILLGSAALPPPPGVDVNDPVSINAHIREYSALQLVVPFLAHALGTLVSAFVAARFSTTRKMAFAMAFGVLGLLGGVMAVRMIPDAPLWFVLLDLIVAYLPMAWWGGLLAMPGK